MKVIALAWKASGLGNRIRSVTDAILQVCEYGGIGIHSRLKICRSESSMRVRIPLLAPNLFFLCDIIFISDLNLRS